jgi:AraC-like DNA-binding protein
MLHFREQDCLAALYQSERISRRQFDELFKKRFDTTPARYITLQKIEYAKQLLGMPHLSIMEVAERSGFSDVYYFSKVFKKETGSTPSAFRKE